MHHAVPAAPAVYVISVVSMYVDDISYNGPFLASDDITRLLNRSKLQDLLHGDHSHRSPALTLPSSTTTP